MLNVLVFKIVSLLETIKPYLPTWGELPGFASLAILLWVKLFHSSKVKISIKENSLEIKEYSPPNDDEYHLVGELIVQILNIGKLDATISEISLEIDGDILTPPSQWNNSSIESIHKVYFIKASSAENLKLYFNEWKGSPFHMKTLFLVITEINGKKHRAELKKPPIKSHYDDF